MALAERDRGPRGDAGAASSLWIDFLLLPEKLEEHLQALAAGVVTAPTPPDLITVFLEQALMNYKSCTQSSALGNNVKDTLQVQLPLAVNRKVGRTAALLCERAARVAVAADLSLFEIESLVVSQQHQFMLLKALVKHDKSRSLIHGCNFHRWLIRNVLQSHPLASAAPNVVFPGAHSGLWALGEDLPDSLTTLENGVGYPLSGGKSNQGITRDALAEEERLSVEFLEGVIMDESNNATTLQGCGDCEHPETVLASAHGAADEDHECEQNSLVSEEAVDSQPGAETVIKQGAHVKNLMSKGYRCQVLLDVGELHFMRGRIRRAHELFTKCSELLADNSAPECVGEPDNSSVQGIIPGLQKLEYSKRNISASLVPLERLGGFIIACQMLLGIPSNLKSGDESSQSLPNFGDNEYPLASLYPLPPAQRAIIACEQSRCYARQDTQVSSVNRPACYKSITLDTSTKRMRIVPVEEEIQESQQMDGIRFASTQSSFQVPVSQYPPDNVPGAKGIESLAALLANQPEHESDQEKSEVIQGVELQESATNKLVRAEETVNAVMPGTLDGTKLIQAVVNDTLDGYIRWGYRLALEKDPQIVISLQCLLVACNIVRHIIEGCSIESCLGMSNTFQNYREGVEFLMLLMAAVKEGFDREGLSLDSATSITVNSNDNVQMQPLGFTKHNLKRKLEEEACFVNNEALVSHICDSALYICCILEKPWCWDAALKHRLISLTQIPIIAAEVPIISATEMDVLLKADDGTNLECTGEDVHLEDGLLWTQQSAKLSTQTRSSTYVSGTSTVRHQLYRAKESLNFSLEEESILSAILRAESLREIESLVLKVKKEDQDCSMEADLELGNSKTTISRMQLSSLPTTSFYRKREEISGRSAFRSIFKIGQFAAKETHSEVVNISVDIAAILRCQAFHALSSRRQSTVAKRLYKLAFATDSNERDSLVMLWLLEHANPAWQQQGVVGIKSLSDRKKLERSDCDVPRNFGLLKYTLLYLVEKELWDDLAELCQWGTSLLKDLSGMEEKSRERKGFNEGAGNKGKATSGHIRHKRFAQTLKVAKTLGDLIQLCTSLQTATGFNHFNKDVAVMGSTVWQLFEEFMCMLVGVDAESQSQRVDDVTEPHGIQSGSAAPGARTVPLIPHVTNSRVLTSLASLMAGWLHRCHAVGRTTWPLAVERYGVLAGVTAGASLPPPVGSLPHAASVYRPVPPRVPPEFGRDLFGVLLEGIVQVPGVLEEDKEKGYRWLQGLADLAFEDEAYVKALQLYLQAGAIRSAHYCDRSSSMPRDVFTPWVIRRMVAACRAIGASLQAAVLCQSLPQPDHESAFHILQENPLVVARDAAAYFDCVWEVPLLELLLYIHAKSGDEEQVTALIALLQQPALNVHNPPSIRIAHVGSLEQRFLQRFAGELL